MAGNLGPLYRTPSCSPSRGIYISHDRGQLGRRPADRYERARIQTLTRMDSQPTTMSLSELPAVVIDENGVLWFNGCTAEERLAAIEGPAHSTISATDRRAEEDPRGGNGPTATCDLVTWSPGSPHQRLTRCQPLTGCCCTRVSLPATSCSRASETHRGWRGADVGSAIDCPRRAPVSSSWRSSRQVSSSWCRARWDHPEPRRADHRGVRAATRPDAVRRLGHTRPGGQW
jgi:hypothetical protein